MSRGHRTPSRTLAPEVEITPADELFAALDGQTVRAGQQAWQLEVWGIHNEGGRFWMQCHLLGANELVGTFPVDPERPADALVSVGGWAAERHADDVGACA
jgi:hypothetical protein